MQFNKMCKLLKWYFTYDLKIFRSRGFLEVELTLSRHVISGHHFKSTTVKNCITWFPDLVQSSLSPKSPNPESELDYNPTGRHPKTRIQKCLGICFRC